MTRQGARSGRRESRDKRPDVFRLWREGRFAEEEKIREARGRGVRKREIQDKTLDLEGMEIVGEATVLEMHRRNAIIRLDQSTEDTLCRFGPKLDLDGFGHLTVGDRVLIGKEEISGELYALQVFERETLFSRPGPPDREHREQLLAANIDRLIVVTSAAKPAFNPGLVDRYLVASQHSNIPLTIIVNKMDLVDEIPDEVVDFEGLADEILFVSAENGEGLRHLFECLEGQTAVFTGQSGVGKSSIIRKLIPGVEIRVGEVRVTDGKGRHTTTSSTLYELDHGGRIIDTPGIRGLGIWNMNKQDLALLFPAFEPWAGSCKFSNCLHRKEPGCSILEAVAEDEIPERAYLSYLRILESLKDS